MLIVRADGSRFMVGLGYLFHETTDVSESEDVVSMTCVSHGAGTGSIRVLGELTNLQRESRSASDGSSLRQRKCLKRSGQNWPKAWPLSSISEPDVGAVEEVFADGVGALEGVAHLFAAHEHLREGNLGPRRDVEGALRGIGDGAEHIDG